MNIYVVVEGRSTEPVVYRSWIPFVNNTLSPIDYISDVQHNNFYIVSGYGYPAIFSAIKAAVSDTNLHSKFDRLVISLDSEDDTKEARYKLVDDYVKTLSPRVEVKIVIQHFCLETWALGNKFYAPRTPQSEPLITFKRIFDVFNNDPELLPAIPNNGLNRAQFAGKYLRACLREKRLIYSKGKPDVIAHKKYFDNLSDRLTTTGHIGSFADFIDAFS